MNNNLKIELTEEQLKAFNKLHVSMKQRIIALPTAEAQEQAVIAVVEKALLKEVNDNDRKWFQNNTKAILKPFNRTVAQKSFTVHDNRVVLEISQPNESEVDRYAEEFGALVEDSYSTVGGVETKPLVNTLLMTVKFTKKGYARILEDGFFIVSNEEKNDIIFRNTQGVLVSWTTKQAAPVKDLQSAVFVLPLYYTAGDQKRLSQKVIRVTGLFKNLSELDEAVNKLSSGQYSYYKGLELDEVKYARVLSRASTISAPSTNIEVDFKPSFAYLIGETIDRRDGQMFTSATFLSKVWSNALERNLRPDVFYGMVYQTRPNASIKAASLGVSDQTLQQIIKSEVEGKTHHFTYDELEINAELKLAVQDVLAGTDRSDAGFNKGDLLFLSESKTQLTPDYYADANTVKASFDPIIPLKANFMKVAKLPKLKTSLSGQGLTSAYALNPTATIGYVSNYWTNKLKEDITVIGKAAPRVISADLAHAENLHHNTIANIGADRLTLLNKSMFRTKASDMFQGLQNSMTANKLAEVDGVYSIAVVDPGHVFGLDVLGHDEVYMKDFSRFAKKQEAKIKTMRESKNPAHVNNADLFEEYLEAGYVAMYRSPKMSTGEVIVRKVVDMKEIRSRVLASNKLNRAQQFALIEMYSTMYPETVVLQGGVDSTNLHSGQDWDIDAFSCIFDPIYVALVKNAPLEALEVDFDTAKAVEVTLADLLETL